MMDGTIPRFTTLSMKTLISLLVFSFALSANCASTAAAPAASAPASAGTAVQAPATGTTINGVVQTRNGIPVQNNTAGQATAGGTTVNGQNNNATTIPAFNRPPAFAGSNSLGANTALGFSNLVNTFNGTNGINSNNLGDVASLLVNLQANIEQSLQVLLSLNPHISNNNPNMNNTPAAAANPVNSAGMATAGTTVNGVNANSRSLTASGTVGGNIPTASQAAAGRTLRPTGNAAGSPAATTVNGNAAANGTVVNGVAAGSTAATANSGVSVGTDPHSLELLAHLETRLRQADAILRNLNGVNPAGADLDGDFDGNAGFNTGTRLNGNLGFTNRFMIVTNSSAQPK